MELIIDLSVFRKIKYLELLHKGHIVLVYIALFWRIIRYICSFLKKEKEPMKVLVKGATGQIGYAIVPMIARGIMLGPDQPVILHLLDIEQKIDDLNLLRMELLGSAFPLLKQVVATIDNVEACKDVNIAIMIAGYSRKDGLDTKDLMSKNVSIYKDVASVLEQHAAADCKVLVVTNPANTNALILKDFAPSIPEKNITCLTRLDHNIALSLIAEKVKVPVSDVKNVIIWGNHDAKQYPDINHATVTIKNEEKPVKECISDDHWLKTEFITNVQQRGAAFNRSQKAKKCALSCASAACDHIHDWVYGTPKGKWVSMGVYSDGSYGIPKDIIYSFPVKCEKGKWSIVQGLTIDALTREKMDVAAKDLKEEISMAKSCLD
ncbi:malate dehydrogenase, cytoplasmic-like [Castanea sativa]|uniref:malate dehydrogenase, cytoplasmic-like n=1 Tax=Castanea sativa TaxID=21020 RepID=UPI003F64E3BC